MTRYEKWRLRATIAWAIVGAILLFLLAVRGLAIVGQAVELLLIGVIVGFVCSPITNWLEDRRVPRSLAALLALIIVVALIVFVVALFVGPFAPRAHGAPEKRPVLLHPAPGWSCHLLGLLWHLGQQSSAALNAVVQMLTEAGSDIASELARNLSTGLGCQPHGAGGATL